MSKTNVMYVIILKNRIQTRTLTFEYDVIVYHEFLTVAGIIRYPWLRLINMICVVSYIVTGGMPLFPLPFTLAFFPIYLQIDGFLRS